MKTTNTLVIHFDDDIGFEVAKQIAAKNYIVGDKLVKLNSLQSVFTDPMNENSKLITLEPVVTGL